MNKLLNSLAAKFGIFRRIFRSEPAALECICVSNELMPIAVLEPVAPSARSIPGCGAREMARRRRQIERGTLLCSR
ncbi:hypothetical protein [Pseudogulbenkiania ferrooxidans]|uniref:Uncharacterized protein n=1 Tax=Pseudogulbenkiania ferrooxidans EGD-HP2 TaxID=1388764 RepID=A0ABP2XMA0_9NEIS|nr:hypothetical protein [Pseudogulbenkiania ferrooxidans]ERE07209.1 hypothetical protein O166_06515 [Pseudogulbenkiania ferrooxidans EGD-HP2]